MRQSSTAWYALCEKLGECGKQRRAPPSRSTPPEHASSSFQLSLSVRLRRDTVTDIVMADTGTPTIGMKRGRDDDDDGTEMEGFGEATRVEKV